MGLHGIGEFNHDLGNTNSIAGTKTSEMGGREVINGNDFDSRIKQAINAVGGPRARALGSTLETRLESRSGASFELPPNVQSMMKQAVQFSERETKTVTRTVTEFSESVRNYKRGSDYTNSTELKSALSSAVRAMLEKHTEPSLDSSKESNVNEASMKSMMKAVLSASGHAVADLMLSESASEHVKIEGDISHHEAAVINDVHDFIGGDSGNISKVDLAKKSYKQLTIAVVKQRQETNPEQKLNSIDLTAILESKGCGKTLTAEDKRNVMANVCQELGIELVAFEGPKVEKKETSAGHVHTEKEARPVEKAGHVKVDSKSKSEVKESSTSGETASSARTEEAIKQADEVAKRRNDAKWADGLVEKLKDDRKGG